MKWKYVMPTNVFNIKYKNIYLSIIIEKNSSWHLKMLNEMKFKILLFCAFKFSLSFLAVKSPHYFSNDFLLLSILVTCLLVLQIQTFLFSVTLRPQPGITGIKSPYNRPTVYISSILQRFTHLMREISFWEPWRMIRK